MKNVLSLVALFLWLSSTAVWAWAGRVVDVTDGDSVVVESVTGGPRVKVRLYGIDCPEKKQPGGYSAHQYVRERFLFKNVEVEEKGTDRYKRTVALLVLVDGSLLQEHLLLAGLAWVYPRYCDKITRSKWNLLEEQARLDRKGLWEEGDPVAPWKWRRNAKKKSVTSSSSSFTPVGWADDVLDATEAKNEASS